MGFDHYPMTAGGLLERGISLSQGSYLYTEQYKHRISTHKHLCLGIEPVTAAFERTRTGQACLIKHSHCGPMLICNTSGIPGPMALIPTAPSTLHHEARACIAGMRNLTSVCYARMTRTHATEDTHSGFHSHE